MFWFSITFAIDGRLKGQLPDEISSFLGNILVSLVKRIFLFTIFKTADFQKKIIQICKKYGRSTACLKNPS